MRSFLARISHNHGKVPLASLFLEREKERNSTDILGIHEVDVLLYVFNL